jgi:hypothetical protein
VYISPENSNQNVSDMESVYEQLLVDVVRYSSLGHIMVQGDFNAYTNTKHDFVFFDVFSRSNTHDVHYAYDQNSPRNNLDPKLINKSGKLLLTLCKESGLRILNGRTIGNLQGRHTCITYNGCSTVDYMLVSNELISKTGYFEVQDYTCLSNHCIISCSLLVSFNYSGHQCQLDPLPTKFVWTQEAINNYIQNINSSESKNVIQRFLQSDFEDCDSAVSSFNSFLYENAVKSAKIVKRYPVSKFH